MNDNQNPKAEITPAELSQLRAELAKTKADLERANAATTTYQTELEQTKTQLTEAQAHSTTLQAQVGQFEAARQVRVDASYNALSDDAKAWVDKFGGEDVEAKQKAIEAYNAIAQPVAPVAPPPAPGQQPPAATPPKPPAPQMPTSRISSDGHLPQAPAKDWGTASQRVAQQIREKVAANAQK